MTQKAAPVMASPEGHSILTIRLKDYKVRSQRGLKINTQTQKKKEGCRPTFPHAPSRSRIGELE